MAAREPDAPPRPTFVNFNNGELNLFISYPKDNGGSSILFLELWVDAGNNFFSGFTKISNYNGLTGAYSVTAADGLSSGVIYRFISRAKNLIGYSEFSVEAFIAFGDTPHKPAAPTRLVSTATSITVKWTEPAAGALTTMGYILNMDDG